MGLLALEVSLLVGFFGSVEPLELELSSVERSLEESLFCSSGLFVEPPVLDLGFDGVGVWLAFVSCGGDALFLVG